MEVEKGNGVWIGQATYLFFVFVSGIMGCIIGKMFPRMVLEKVPGWRGCEDSMNKIIHATATIRRLGLDKNGVSKGKEAEALKKATLEIGQNWMHMMKMLEDIRGEQISFANRLQSEMETRNQNLYQNVADSLEEEFLRNDQRCAKFKQMIESMHEDISFLKNSVESFPKVSNNDEGVIEEGSLVEKCSQKRKAQGHSKFQNSLVIENEGSKLVAMVKECLTCVIKDAKLQISIDREDENRELQIIFQKLVEDRKEIKKTIIKAFSHAAEQTRKNFDQFGQDAIHYIAVLNENTNKMLKVKFEETDERLKEILRALNRQILDVVTIQKILENIDGQFDDIFQRVELGCQRNTENCEEIAQDLENTSHKFINATSELGSMTEDFGNNIEMFQGMLNDIKGVMNSINSKNVDNHLSSSTEGDEIVHYDLTEGTESKDVMTLSQKNQHIFMYNVIQTCWEKMTNTNDRIEDGCTEICQQFQNLAQKLQSLNASAETLEDAIKNVNMEYFTGRIVCRDHDSGKIENVTKVTTGDSGDCMPHIHQRRRPALFKNTLTEIIQGYGATMKSEEMKLAELNLEKTIKENSINFNEAEINHDVQGSIPLIAEKSQVVN